MSRPDYEQTILHHSTLLVLLRGVGVSKPRSLQKVFDKVKRVNNVKIQGMLRVMSFGLLFFLNIYFVLHRFEWCGA